MPCDGDGHETLTDKDKEINKLTEMLCSACRALDKYTDYDFDTNPMLSKWWHRHKKEDIKKYKLAQLIDALLKKPFGELTSAHIDLLKENGYL